MKVNELADMLAILIAQGLGNDEVLVNVYGDDVDSHMVSILNRHDWTVTKVFPDGDHGTSWVGLDVHPTD